MEIVFACALLEVHLSRLGRSWCSGRRGVRLRAPRRGALLGQLAHAAEAEPRYRGAPARKPGRLVGDVVALLTVSKGLTLAYNKDLQETQEPLYDAIETTRLSLAVLPNLVAGLEFGLEKMAAAAADPALGATDLAEHLVRTKAVPFRRAHEIVGSLVRYAEEKGVSLRELPESELPRIAPELDAAALDALDPGRAVAARNLTGGPAPAQVLAQVERLEAELRGLGFEI